MNRTKFYNVATVEGVQELDHMSSKLTEFKIRRRTGYYRIQAQDIKRPDLISARSYGTVYLWWFLLFVNGIQNPLTEMVEGDSISIPGYVDLYDQFKTLRRRA